VFFLPDFKEYISINPTIIVEGHSDNSVCGCYVHPCEAHKANLWHENAFKMSSKMPWAATMAECLFSLGCAATNKNSAISLVEAKPSTATVAFTTVFALQTTLFREY
jgi:hypothetical protein